MRNNVDYIRCKALSIRCVYVRSRAHSLSHTCSMYLTLRWGWWRCARCTNFQIIIPFVQLNAKFIVLCAHPKSLPQKSFAMGFCSTPKCIFIYIFQEQCGVYVLSSNSLKLYLILKAWIFTFTVFLHSHSTFSFSFSFALFLSN